MLLFIHQECFGCVVMKVVFCLKGAFRHCGGDLLLSRDKSKQNRSAQKEGVARSGTRLFLSVEF